MPKAVKKRIVLFTIALLIVFIGLTSVLQATHHHHNGYEENCGICLFLHQSKNTLKNILSLGNFDFLLLLMEIFLCCLFLYTVPAVHVSPVSLKVKMNN